MRSFGLYRPPVRDVPTMQTLSATRFNDGRAPHGGPHLACGRHTTLRQSASLLPDVQNRLVVRHRIAQVKRRLSQLYTAVDNRPPSEEGSRQA